MTWYLRHRLLLLVGSHPFHDIILDPGHRSSTSLLLTLKDIVLQSVERTLWSDALVMSVRFAQQSQHISTTSKLAEPYSGLQLQAKQSMAHLTMPKHETEISKTQIKHLAIPPDEWQARTACTQTNEHHEQMELRGLSGSSLCWWPEWTQ